MTPTDPPPPPEENLAAVDLGSNSFHMVVARTVDGELRLVDRLKERIALASGLVDDGGLTEEAQERALRCLERFGQRLRDFDSEHVRAVGTNTLRQASKDSTFLERAAQALGHPIDVISGKEEGRLIYQGVCSTQVSDLTKRLVIDIGGGSTEFILGEGPDPVDVHSLFMGCVSFTRRYFPHGELSKPGFREAQIAAAAELRTIARTYRYRGWGVCIGSSGTITAVEQILRLNEWSEDGIDRRGLKRLRRALYEGGRIDGVRLDGLSQERAQSLPGGLAILLACFNSLRIERMLASKRALREGLLHDLIGRIHHEDIRDKTVLNLCGRYAVDLAQAERVERCAVLAFNQVHRTWGLDPVVQKRLLRWASRLHEIGLSLSYTGYHRHGAYLVANSEMAGFSRQEQQLLSGLVGCHRRKIVRERATAGGAYRLERVRHLLLLLRIAVLLNRSRTHKPLPDMTFAAAGDRLTIHFPEGWLDRHPLSRRGLEEESFAVAALGFELEFR